MSSGYSPPPWKPPDSSGGIDPIQFLGLLQRKQQIEQERAQFEQKIQSDAEEQVVKGMEAGLSLKALIQAHPNIPANKIDAYKEIEKQLKAKRDQESLTSPTALQAVSSAVQGSISPAGQYVPPSPEQTGSVGQTWLSLDDAGKQLLNNVVGGAQGEQRARADAFRAAEAQRNRGIAVQGSESRRTASYEMGIREAAQIRAEKRAEAEKNRQVADAAVSGAFTGLQNGDITPDEFSQSIAGLASQGVSPIDISRSIHHAITVGPAQLAELRRNAMSVDKGKNEAEIVGNDLREHFKTQGFNVDSTPAGDWRLMARGKATVDPIAATTGEISFEVGNTSELEKWKESRIALGTIRSQMEATRSTYKDLEAAYKAGKIPFVGPGVPKGASDLMTWLGQGSPEAEAFNTTSFLTMTAILKMMQGSRPSDYDAKSYLAVFPTLQEVGSPTAAAKLDALQRLLDTQAGFRGGRTGADKEAFRPPATPEDQAITGKLLSFAMKDEQGNIIGIDPAKRAQFDAFIARDLPAWQSKRGSAWTPPGVSGPAPSRSLDAVGRVRGGQ